MIKIMNRIILEHDDCRSQEEFRDNFISDAAAVHIRMNMYDETMQTAYISSASSHRT
jgi:hypothetical protein